MKLTAPGRLTELFGDRDFFRSLLHLALPIALQNLLINSLTFADTIMVGRLGETAIASVGLGNQIFFVYSLFLFGIGSGSGIFVAQFWGKKDIPGIRRTQGVCLTLNTAVGICFALLAFLIPGKLLSLFSSDPEVLRLGSSYLRIIAPIFILTSIIMSYSIVLRNVEKAKVPMVVTLIALVCNVILNYVFIFGVGPVPAMGVVGAALGTTISRCLEMFLMLWFVYGRKAGKTPLEVPAAAGLAELFSYTREYLGRYFRTAAPVILNEIAWGIGMTMYKVVYGRVGTDALATMNISETITNLMFIFFAGTGNAAAAMIGKTIGEGRSDRTYSYGRRFLVLAPVMGVAVGGLLVLLSGHVVKLFNVSAQVRLAATQAMWVYALFLPAKAINMHLIVGIFRGGGDTKFGLLFDVLGLWCLGIPLAFVGGLVWGLPVPGIYFLALTEEVFKLFLGLPRFFSRKWINDITGTGSGTGAGSLPASAPGGAG